MRRMFFSSIMLASSIAYTGCGSGGDPGGGGGSGASGGGGGSAGSLSFNAESALPAAGAAASAIAFSATLGSTVGAVLAAVDPGLLAAPRSALPKADLPVTGTCPGGGTASVDQTGAVVTITLTDCVGVGVGAEAASGRAVLTITDTGSNGLRISATAVLDLMIGTDTVVEGEFFASVDLARAGQLQVRLGDALDGDLLTATEAGQTALGLGCFDVRLTLETVPALQLIRITPISVVRAPIPGSPVGEVFSINDHSRRVTSITEPINIDDNGVPSGGAMTLYSGDQSGADTDRMGASCPGFGAPGDDSFVTATFSPGGCIELVGEDSAGAAFGGESSWDKLLAGDFSPGGGEGCGPDVSVMCDALEPGDITEVLSDSDFPDSNWEVEFVPTEGAVYDAPIVREASGGIEGSAFRNMTHTIESAANCAESCTLGAVHKFATTYDPSVEGAIRYINYTEAQRVVMPGFNGAAVGWAFAVVQDERRYNALAETSSFTNTGWAINGICGLVAEDFGPADGPHPDFSASGGELTFAYIRSNTNSSEDGPITNVHGIDDFEVVIVKE